MRYPTLVPLINAFAVFPLWLIERLIPYPFLLEEIFKYFVVKYIIISASKQKLNLVFLSAFTFSLSESFLYLSQTFLSGSIRPFIFRLVITLPMHMLTYVIIYLGTAKGAFKGLIALIIAIFIHFFFNQILLQTL